MAEKCYLLRWFWDRSCIQSLWLSHAMYTAADAALVGSSWFSLFKCPNMSVRTHNRTRKSTPSRCATGRSNYLRKLMTWGISVATLSKTAPRLGQRTLLLNTSPPPNSASSSATELFRNFRWLSKLAPIMFTVSITVFIASGIVRPSFAHNACNGVAEIRLCDLSTE